MAFRSSRTSVPRGIALQAVHGLRQPPAGTRRKAVAGQHGEETRAAAADGRAIQHHPQPCIPPAACATSGTLAGLRLEVTITESDILSLVFQQKPLNWAEHIYSNTGYTLLGWIVRRVSGQSLADFAHEPIFAPEGPVPAGGPGPVRWHTVRPTRPISRPTTTHRTRRGGR